MEGKKEKNKFSPSFWKSEAAVFRKRACLLFGSARSQFAERGPDVHVCLKIIAGGCANFVEIGVF